MKRKLSLKVLHYHQICGVFLMASASAADLISVWPVGKA